MNYLKKHVKLKIQSNLGTNQSEESFEFEITEEDLKLDDNDEDMNDILIEFDDEILFDGQDTLNNKKIDTKQGTDEKDKELDETEITTTTIATVEDLPKEPELQSFTIELPAATPPKPVVDPSVRNEDVIFGELIVSQLMKMSDEAKKRAIKRSILDLFF